jgi:hypothetical protein
MVYGVTGETPFGEGVTHIFYQGECHMYGSSTLRTFKQQGVIKGEYAIDIPKLVKGVNSGDLVDVTNYNGTFTGCVVTNSMPVVYGKYEGTTIYFNLPKN